MDKMKTYRLLFIAVLLSFIGCSDPQDDDVQPERPKVRFSASSAQDDSSDINSASRAIMDDNYKSVWEEGDYFIAAADGIDEFYLDITSDAGSSRATFEGDAYVETEGVYDFCAAHNALWIDATSATFEIPNRQYGVPYLLAVAKDEGVNVTGTDIGLNFKFKSQNSFLRIDMSAYTDIQSVTLRTVGGEYVAGTYIYDFQTGTASIIDDGAASTDITVFPAIGESIFYFLLPGGITFSEGFLLIFTNSRYESTILRTGANKTFERAKYYNTLPLPPFNPFIVDKTITARTSYSDYIDGDVAAANAWTATDCKISGEIAYNQNLPLLVQIVETGYTINNKYYPYDNGNPILAHDIPAGTHSAQSYVKDQFGNYYKSDVTPVIISGLPYDISMVADTKWTESERAYGYFTQTAENGIVFTSSDGINIAKGVATSPEFRFPVAGTKIAYTLTGVTTTSSSLSLRVNTITHNITTAQTSRTFRGTFTAGVVFDIAGTFSVTRRDQLTSGITVVNLNYGE